MHRQDSFAVQEENEEDEESQHPSGKSESEEEDYESFFLQPASCPYNIKEKIAEANAQLLQESMNDTKNIKVTFRHDLVDFEPDLTDDDVQSIESYTEEVINVDEELKYVLDKKLCNIEEEIIEESIFETIIELNHQKQCREEDENENGYSSSEETEEIEEERIEQVEEIDEDLIEEIDQLEDIVGSEEIEEIVEIDDIPDVSETIEENEEDIETFCIIEECPEVPDENPTLSEIEKPKSLSISLSPSSINLKTTSTKKTVKSIKTRRLPHKINCKKHCVQELESRLDLCINNLRLNENVTKLICPTLRLHRQKCCSEGCKIEQKLPLYTGVHSEYGLSSSQIERLTKRKELTKLKEEKERELTEAYRRRKIHQNEIIFRQWLKDIAERRHVEQEREKEIISRTDRTHTSRSKTSKNYRCNGFNSEESTQRIEVKEKQEKHQQYVKNMKQKPKKFKPRPQTANCITNLELSVSADGKSVISHVEEKKLKKQRPHTTSSSTARIYIEIPQHLLNDGFSLGQLFIKQLEFNNDDTVKNKNKSVSLNTKKTNRLHILTKVHPST